MKLRVLVQPRAAKSQIVGVHGDRLKIRLKAAPVDGAANDELVRLMAEVLALPRSQIQLQAGQTSKQKTLSIAGEAKIPSDWSPACF